MDIPATSAPIYIRQRAPTLRLSLYLDLEGNATELRGLSGDDNELLQLILYILSAPQINEAHSTHLTTSRSDFYLKTHTITMEALRLKPRKPVEEEIESWDDGDLMVDSDAFSVRSGSNLTRPPSRRRDSNSSHLSRRSDLESWAEEEEQHVHIPGDDANSTLAAISAAQSAGIPLPQNVPSSALTGGTIRRLGGRKIRRIVQEDWENDLELPDNSHGLKIKPKARSELSEFSEVLRQGSSSGSVHTSPVHGFKSSPAHSPGFQRSPGLVNAKFLSSGINLDKFKDNDDDDDFLGDGNETIKVPQTKQTLKPVSLITPPTPSKQEEGKGPEDDFETDLELPFSGKLQLSTKRDIPKTPSIASEDIDWGEGSLGTRYGGTWRDRRSNRSSSASALSPSVSSSITAESEDETFDGLVLPPGPVDFRARLEKRRNSRSPNRKLGSPVSSPPKKLSPKKSSPAEADKPDFLDGLDFGDGDVFSSGKLTLHRNIKVREARPSSPARPKTAVSLTFGNKPVSSRLPRLSHERSHSIPLEPVSESGGPIPQRVRRPASRFGHSSQSSLSSIPTPTTPSPNQRFHPSTPSRRELGTKTSTPSLRNEPTTTSAQLLKQKRSLPAIRALNPPSKQLVYRDRPSSRSDGRPHSNMRPKTPNEQQRSPGFDSPASQARRSHQPFLPAGASQSKSQHVVAKSGRQFRRHDSDNSIDLRPNSRTNSRGTRSPSPQQRVRVAADTWERLSRPKHKKHFGDGHELDCFDDLPTSKDFETRYTRQPTSAGSKTSSRPKSFHHVAPDRMFAASPVVSTTTALTPRFARDTAASRIARETSLATRSAFNGPLAPIVAQRGTQPLRSHLDIQAPAKRSKRNLKKVTQSKPHLISNLNSGKEPKSMLSVLICIVLRLTLLIAVNGMYYNAATFRWEGNENALSAFDASISTPSPVSISYPASREKDLATPRPALITNISATKGVQVVNGMVFDPQTMSWLKLGAQTTAKSESGDLMENFNALDDEDVFKDIPDLDDGAGDNNGGHGRVSDINDEWMVGEEFDVGPEFIRRQREEEERWRKKCSKWTGKGQRDRETWRWTIRELVSQFDDFSV